MTFYLGVNPKINTKLLLETSYVKNITEAFNNNLEVDDTKDQRLNVFIGVFLC